jgi:hypothetical protein
VPATLNLSSRIVRRRIEPGHVRAAARRKNQEASITASSISMIGMSSFTAYTRWHCLHFKLSGFSRYSSGCLQAGQTRISSRSLAIMGHCTTGQRSAEVEKLQGSATPERSSISGSVRFQAGSPKPGTRSRKPNTKCQPESLMERRLAADIRAEVAADVEDPRCRRNPAGVSPWFSWGHDPASEIYVRGKVKACEEVGIYSEKLTPPESASPLTSCCASDRRPEPARRNRRHPGATATAAAGRCEEGSARGRSRQRRRRISSGQRGVPLDAAAGVGALHARGCNGDPEAQRHCCRRPGSSCRGAQRHRGQAGRPCCC